jgi:sugar/nucleoside kinase (ribokinase family)
MKIIGIGNALLDVLLRLDSDRTLLDAGMAKGAMDIIDEAKMRGIQKAQSGLQRVEAPGGSVCNTIRAMARLGADAGYIGKVGTDRAGKIYEDEIRKAGVNPFLARAEGISGCSTVLISPDGERTMATFLGPAATLSAAEISDDMLRLYDVLYMEGYLISNEPLFLPILKRAKRLGLKVALDLSNFNIVHGFRDLLKEVIPSYVDILFSNESEAEAYTGLPAREAIHEIAREVGIAVVTIGKDGALIKSGGRLMPDPADGRVMHQPASESRVADTTGAGDHFAAGFLFGFAQGATLEQAARIGSLLSGHVIETIGAQIEENRWVQIKLKVDAILGR